MEIGRVHPPFDGMDPEFVGGPVGVAPLHAPSCHPHRVAGDVVVAAVLSLGGRRRVKGTDCQRPQATITAQQ